MSVAAPKLRGSLVDGIHPVKRQFGGGVDSPMNGRVQFDRWRIDGVSAMRQVLAIARAIGDESRARALLALREGELCLCQIIDLLKLSPSTVSKHLDVLQQAGLVERRKAGRWHYFRLANHQAKPVVRRAIKWVLESLQDEAVAIGDAKKLCCVRQKDPRELSACYKG